jgi:hypothetical protein
MWVCLLQPTSHPRRAQVPGQLQGTWKGENSQRQRQSSRPEGLRHMMGCQLPIRMASVRLTTCTHQKLMMTLSAMSSSPFL